jgi:hypothetical protein
MKVADNLNNYNMRVVGQMTEVISDGAFEGGFPEITYAARQHGQNLAEFGKFTAYLIEGLQHTGNAAQAIADSYGDKDGFSAIELNTVNFAFGVFQATRPSGLPSRYGETYSEAADKAAAAAAAAPKGDQKAAGHPDSIWSKTTDYYDESGGSTTTYVDQYGDVRTVSVTYDARGHKITKMVGPDGTTTSDEVTFSFEFGSYTTTVNTGADGKVSTTQSDTTYGGNTTTVEASTDGQLKTVTTVTYNPDGSETRTTYAVQANGDRKITSQVTVGHDNDVQHSAPDWPSNDALQADNAVIQAAQKDDGMVTRAPGAPNSTAYPMA